MKRLIRITVLLAGLFIIISNASAQYIQTQYHLGIPQSAQLNPSFRPNANVHIGLPVISSIYIGMSNNLMNMGNIFEVIPGTDSIMTVLHPDYDRDAFFRRLGNKAFVSAETQIQILRVGFSINDDWWVDLGTSLRASARANIPDDLFRLIFDGNEDFIGSSINLSGMGFNSQTWLESHIGLSKNITDKLRVGGRLKIIQGMVGASLEAERLEIEVNEDFSHALYTDMVLRVNAPLDVTYDENNFIDDLQLIEPDGFPTFILPSFKNFGTGIDIGAQYQLFDNLNLSASLIDLGFISWGKNTFTYRANNSFTFDGFDISDEIAGDVSFDDLPNQLLDSLTTTFDFVDSEESYTTGIPAKLYLAGSYKPLDFLALGALSRTTIGMGVRQSLTLSATLMAGDWLTTSLSYTMTNRNFTNFGFGMGIRGGPIQFYAVLDQIPANWVQFTDNSGSDPLVMPQRLDYMNFRFGVNLLFGRPEKKAADTPMLVE